MRASWVVGVALASLVAIWAGRAAIRMLVQGHAAAPFNRNVTGFLVPFSGEPENWLAELDSGGGDEAAYPSASVRPPFVVIERERQKLDPVFFDLPSEWRASDPSTARTVILSAYRRLVAGRYQWLIPVKAYSCTAGYVFVNSGTHRVVATHFITNPPHAQTSLPLLFFTRTPCPNGTDLARYIRQSIRPVNSY